MLQVTHDKGSLTWVSREIGGGYENQWILPTQKFDDVLRNNIKIIFPEYYIQPLGMLRQ